MNYKRVASVVDHTIVVQIRFYSLCIAVYK